MRRLIKYPLALLILLLVGYGQLFVPIYRGLTFTVSTEEANHVAYIQAHGMKTAGLENFFIVEEEKEEREDDRISIRKVSRDGLFVTHTNSVSSEHLFQFTRKISFAWKYSSGFSLFASSYLALRVFRL